jgi:hypothetical protein
MCGTTQSGERAIALAKAGADVLVNYVVDEASAHARLLLDGPRASTGTGWLKGIKVGKVDKL